MAISFMQKLRLALRGWNRRREEETTKKEQEFLQRNVTWGRSDVAPASAGGKSSTKVGATFDLEGLQVAFLDDSGKIAHYLDVETGDVIEFGIGERRDEITGQPGRYKRVPTRSATSEDADRRDFAAGLDSGPLRDQLLRSADASEFRRALSSDRAIERAWYNFKNDRATQTIAKWLKDSGLRTD